MNKYDAVVVGSGTAGQTAAYDLQQSGMKVAVVEKTSSPGGVCAQSGCQPKKWFYEAAETIAKCRNLTGKGIVAAPQASWTQVLKEKNRFTSVVPANTVKGFQEAGIGYIEGQARFQDRNTLTVNGQQLAADAFVIATGARPMSLPFPGAEHLLTSDDWLNLESLPAQILFVGGGFIAFEFAHFAVRLGPVFCRAVILEAGDRPLGPFDAEMVDLLVTAGLKVNIDIHTNVEITAIEKKDGVVTLTGIVSEETHKQLAEETVGSMASVKGVINKLEIMGEGPVAQSNAWVMLKIKTSLLYHRSVSGMDTEVNVQDGVVTLRGNAASQEQKDQTTEYAGDIEGVKEVKNEMIIVKTPEEPGAVKAAVKEVKRDMAESKTPVATAAKPAVAKMDTRTESVDDASITALVKTMMMNRRSTSGLDTRVATKDAVVTLSGKVKDPAVKEMVTKYVSDIHGVKQVINNITVQ